MVRARRQGEMAIGAIGPLASLFDPRRVPGMLRAVAGGLAGGVKTAPALRSAARWVAIATCCGRRCRCPVCGRSSGAPVPLNDVVLAVVAGALRRHLGDERSAELAEQPPLRVGSGGIPEDGEEGTGNAFSALVAELPVATADPFDRLAQIHDDMVRHKQGAGSSMVSSLFSVVDVVPPTLLRQLGPLALARQPFTVTWPSPTFPVHPCLCTCLARNCWPCTRSSPASAISR